MPNEHRLTIPARLDQVEVACDFVAQNATECGLDDDAIYHCRLSVEEICTNVIEHGYGQQNVNQNVEIVCGVRNAHFVITIIDDAPLFDPLSLPDPDPSTPLWERQGGGWGVYFVKKYMDRVTYSNRDRRNHLIMEKRT